MKLTAMKFLTGSSYHDGGRNGSGGGASATQSYGVYNADQLKASRETFFEKQQEKNAARPDHLPPSQGGKYAGFGNQAYTPPAKTPQQEMLDNTWASGENMSDVEITGGCPLRGDVYQKIFCISLLNVKFLHHFVSLLSVSSGWGMFASSAAKFAAVAKDNAVKYGSKAVESVNENVVKPTATRVKDGKHACLV